MPVLEPSPRPPDGGESGPPEGHLITRAQGGDVRAFEALIADHIPRVRRFARAFAGDEADADDLAQDALVKVYRSLHGYRFQAAFSTWLYAVVKNAFLDQRKSRAHNQRAREQNLDDAMAHTTGGPDAEESLLAEEDRKTLWAAIARVPTEFRTALVLFEVEGLSYDEIAAVEKVAVGTVKSRVSRARDHLRRLLGVADGNPDGVGLVSPARTSR